jgi:hypothetical protein
MAKSDFVAVTRQSEKCHTARAPSVHACRGGFGILSAPAIETTDLVKSFGDNRAVDGVDLTVPANPAGRISACSPDHFTHP